VESRDKQKQQENLGSQILRATEKTDSLLLMIKTQKRQKKIK
jgi:hypothetical protein